MNVLVLCQIWLIVFVSGCRSDVKECEDSCDHGKCQFLGGDQLFCVCDEGWQGVSCNMPLWDKTELEECEDSCDHGKCQSLGGHQLFCVCDEGWQGVSCNMRMCEHDCYNGGVCKTDDLTVPPYCVCTPEWTGDACSIDIKCEKNCIHGECMTLGGDQVYCVCEEGWQGVFCNIRLCEHDCYNGGVCKAEDWTKPPYCACPPEWSGDSCTISV